MFLYIEIPHLYIEKFIEIVLTKPILTLIKYFSHID
jgi:hypothetical protein